MNSFFPIVNQVIASYILQSSFSQSSYANLLFFFVMKDLFLQICFDFNPIDIEINQEKSLHLWRLKFLVKNSGFKTKIHHWFETVWFPLIYEYQQTLNGFQEERPFVTLCPGVSVKWQSSFSIVVESNITNRLSLRLIPNIRLKCENSRWRIIEPVMELDTLKKLLFLNKWSL